ncbi:MAG: helix-turn-helix domain-containing protein [Verrucomicrobiales bacterium]
MASVEINPQAAWYSPEEFAELFGKERSWAYRMLQKKKVQAITGYGHTKIPHSEAERLLADLGPYAGRRATKPDDGGDPA